MCQMLADNEVSNTRKVLILHITLVKVHASEMYSESSRL